MNDYERAYLRALLDDHPLPEQAMGQTMAMGQTAQNQNGYLRGGQDKLVSEQSEVERELSRLARANESLRMAVEAIWAKSGSALNPPAPGVGDSPAQAIEGCGSPLGNALQQQAIAVEETAGRIRYLVRSLAL